MDSQLDEDKRKVTQMQNDMKVQNLLKICDSGYFHDVWFDKDESWVHLITECCYFCLFL